MPLVGLLFSGVVNLGDRGGVCVGVAEQREGKLQ